MKILILGGTVFLGRHIVDAALARGHEVTLFNRGQHNAELFPQVEKLRGDRDGDLTALQGRSWDAVIDPSGYVPRLVRASAELLADAVEHYTFISSISVYAETKTPGMDESAPVGTLADPTTEEVGPNYGPLKALCEQAAEAAMPGRTASIRAGLIVGPWDPTNRFTYWPARIARGGDVLLPDHAGRAVQIVDVRDLAEWNIALVEGHVAGVFNATGPDYVLTMGDVYETCKQVSGSDARPVWVAESFLTEREVGPWMELPLWVPDTEEYRGFMSIDCSRAINAGLRFRPLAETVRDTLAWNDTLPPDAERRAGMAAAREAELLEAWRARA